MSNYEVKINMSITSPAGIMDTLTVNMQMVTDVDMADPCERSKAARKILRAAAKRV